MGDNKPVSPLPNRLGADDIEEWRAYHCETQRFRRAAREEAQAAIERRLEAETPMTPPTSRHAHRLR